MIRIRIRPVIMLAVAAGAAIGLTAAMLPASSAAAVYAPRMNATQLANGLLFDQGKAKRYLTVLDRPPVIMTRELTKLKRLVDTASREHPVLAAKFAGDVQSGNRIRVDAGLSILARFTVIALRHEFGKVITQDVIKQAKALLGGLALASVDDGEDSASASETETASETADTSNSSASASSSESASESASGSDSNAASSDSAQTASCTAGQSTCVAVVGRAAVVVVVVSANFAGSVRSPSGSLAAQRITNLVAISLKDAR